MGKVKLKIKAQDQGDSKSIVIQILNKLFVNGDIRNINNKDKIHRSFSFKAKTEGSGIVQFNNSQFYYAIKNGKLHVIEKNVLDNKFKGNASEWLKGQDSHNPDETMNKIEFLDMIADQIIDDVEMSIHNLKEYLYEEYKDSSMHELKALFGKKASGNAIRTLIEDLNANEDELREYDEEDDVDYNFDLDDDEIIQGQDENIKAKDGADLQYSVPFEDIESLTFDTVEYVANRNVRFVRDRDDENSRYTLEIDLSDIIDGVLEEHDYEEQDPDGVYQDYIEQIAEKIANDLSEYYIDEKVFIETYL